MRKHDVRKWLHAILDLLPVIIIPVFMIYSHRHQIDNYEVQYAQNEIIDFNQQVKNGNFVDSQYWFRTDNVSFDVSSNIGTFTVLQSYGAFECRVRNIQTTTIEGHQYYIHADIKSSSTDLCGIGIYGIGSVNITPTVNVWEEIRAIRTCSMSFIGTGEFSWGYESAPALNATLSCRHFMVMDLTQMFGFGYEPTLSEVESYFTEPYYDYVLSRKELLNVGTISYNDTDIGSQFVYALYKPINQYFNLSQVGVFGQLYDFLQVNMFNGNAPISIFIVYHVILYELIMDLIFLIYCVFMFIIDFAEKMLDSFFDMSFGGGKR